MHMCVPVCECVYVHSCVCMYVCVHVCMVCLCMLLSVKTLLPHVGLAVIKQLKSWLLLQ